MKCASYLQSTLQKECHFEGKHLMSSVSHPVKHIQINHKIIQKSNPTSKRIMQKPIMIDWLVTVLNHELLRLTVSAPQFC